MMEKYVVSNKKDVNVYLFWQDQDRLANQQLWRK